MSEELSEEQKASSATKAVAAPLADAAFSMRGLGVTIVRVSIIGGFLLLWEVASGRWVEPFLISSPSRIVISIIAGIQSGELLQHLWVTFQEIAIGFPLGAISGIALGYWFGRSRLLAEIFEPVIIALNG